jgi:hypothetical protein
MSELVDEGVSGFLVDSAEEAVGAVSAASGLERMPIRSAAVARFGRDRMVDDYVAAYHQLLSAKS